LAKSLKRHTFYFQLFAAGIFSTFNDLALVVLKTLNSAIQRIKFIQWIKCYTRFEQPGPAVEHEGIRSGFIPAGHSAGHYGKDKLRGMKVSPSPNHHLK